MREEKASIDSSKHCRFTPGTPVSYCNDTRPKFFKNTQLVSFENIIKYIWGWSFLDLKEEQFRTHRV
jgi:hypothetical protein